MKTPDLITETVAPLGPNARAMLSDREHTRRRKALHARGLCGCYECVPAPDANNHRATVVIKQPSPRPTVANVQPSLTTRELQAVLRETLLVLREQGIQLTDKQIEDRVGNGVMKILGLFEIHYVGE